MGQAPSPIRALLHAPALHFLLLGALLAALGARTTGPAAATARAPIVITATRVAEIRDEYRQSVLAVPTSDELAALIARAADEEMLYREALLLGLDRGDRAVKWRVVEKMHFLYGDEAGDTEAAYRRGLALGLERDDIVVRNVLVTKMRLLAKAASRSDEPSGPVLEHELEAYLHSHSAAYTHAERLSLTQLFLANDKRGAGLAADAQALLRRLRDARTTPEAAGRLGDAFVSGTVFANTSRRGLAKIFGEAFATAASTLDLGRWSEPIPSPYGLHLVWVTARDATSLPALADVRPRVLRAFRAERRAAYLERMMDELRAAYEVRVEHGEG